MEVCPLCKIPVADGDKATQIRNQQPHPAYDERNPGLLKRIFLQITCVLLLSGILATLIINLAMVGHITWSVYPITLCLIVLSYVFSLELWTVKALLRILAGRRGSWLMLQAVRWCVSRDWRLKLALPIRWSMTVITRLLGRIGGEPRVRGRGMVAR